MTCGVVFLSRSSKDSESSVDPHDFLISWLERTHIEIKSHPALFVFCLSAGAMGQHQDSCSCNLAEPCEKLCGIDLALSFIVFISHEGKQ